VNGDTSVSERHWMIVGEFFSSAESHGYSGVVKLLLLFYTAVSYIALF